MPTGYGEATTEVAQQLREAGLPVETNAQDLTLPGGWLTPNGIEFDRLGLGEYTGRWSLFLVTRNNDPITSLDDLWEMAAQVRAVFPSYRAQALTVTLANHSPEPLPAFRIEIEMSVS